MNYWSQEQIRERLQSSLYHRWANIELDVWAPGRVELTADVSDVHLNPQGIVHGGVLAGLLDSACGLALRTLLPVELSHRTLSINITYLRPAKVGHLRVIGKAISKGRSVGHAEAEVVTDEGKSVARATAVFMTIPRPGDETIPAG